ncbi:hypothetical protein ANN_07875 [Periplaneta americana]|uniref:Uncharacterized protein n=1 Tax=Periplaneta americana TaxID=6978 RepID=A0ABQ8T1E0_PERAM|nr:hypothetical protein ANN_07875 [Periplaneta americana]
MSPGSSTESYPAFARIGMRENPEKPQPGLPRPGFEPGPPAFAARRADRYSTATGKQHARKVRPRNKFGTVKNYWPEFVIIGLEDVKAARTLMVDILNSTCEIISFKIVGKKQLEFLEEAWAIFETRSGLRCIESPSFQMTFELGQESMVGVAVSGYEQVH